MTEREDTIERIERVLKLTRKESITVTIPRLTAEQAVSMLKEQETIVRCIDCKHHRENNCEVQIGVYDPNWFCADGERR